MSIWHDICAHTPKRSLFSAQIATSGLGESKFNVSLITPVADKCSSDTLLRHMRSHPAPRRNKPVRQNANSATGGILSPIPQESGRFPSHGISDMAQNASSIIVENQAQNAGNALVGRGDDDSDIAYPGINTGRQSLLHMDASNSSASHVPGLQNSSFEFSSPNNGKSIFIHFQELLLIMTDITPSAWGTMTIDAQPSLGIDDDFMNVSSASLDVSDMNSLSSTWFAGDDFDLDALNSAIQESIAHYAYPMQSYPTDHHRQLPSIEHVETEGVLPTHPSLPLLYSSSINKKWFSNIEVDPEAPETRQGSQGPGSAQVDVDEAYRVNLTSKLQVRAQNESLPSTEFLVNSNFHCLCSLLILLESLHTNVFHALQYYIPSTARPHISAISKELTFAAINLLRWKLIHWISGCDSSGHEDF